MDLLTSLTECLLIYLFVVEISVLFLFIGLSCPLCFSVAYVAVAVGCGGDCWNFQQFGGVVQQASFCHSKKTPEFSVRKSMYL